MTEQEFIENERNKRLITIDKSENDLEKKVTYISAGGLALSISFIDKVVDLNSATYLFILISGWGLLAITLILNLFGIFWSRKLTVKGLAEYDKEIPKKSEDRVPIEVLNAKTVKRNNNIMRLDLASLITLTIGIITIVLFCSLNVNNKKTENIMSGKKTIIEKGRIAPTASPVSHTPNINIPESGNNNTGATSAPNSNESTSTDKN